MPENRKCQKSKRMGQGMQHLKKLLHYGIKHLSL